MEVTIGKSIEYILSQFSAKMRIRTRIFYARVWNTYKYDIACIITQISPIKSLGTRCDTDSLTSVHISNVNDHFRVRCVHLLTNYSYSPVHSKHQMKERKKEGNLHKVVQFLAWYHFTKIKVWRNTIIVYCILLLVYVIIPRLYSLYYFYCYKYSTNFIPLLIITYYYYYIII